MPIVPTTTSYTRRIMPREWDHRIPCHKLKLVFPLVRQLSHQPAYHSSSRSALTNNNQSRQRKHPTFTPVTSVTVSREGKVAWNTPLLSVNGSMRSEQWNREIVKS